MSDLNSTHNRAVWFDIPVANLDRALAFYSGGLNVKVGTADAGGTRFGVLEHDQGNGGCLIEAREKITSSGGILVYMNVDGRIRAAVGSVEALGGKVLEPTHSIGPHGFRAVVLDSEGNRIALHSAVDA